MEYLILLYIVIFVLIGSLIYYIKEDATAIKKPEGKKEHPQYPKPEPKPLDSFKEYHNIEQIDKRWQYERYYRNMEKEDELYEYLGSWRDRSGRRGIIIVRDGFVIEDYVSFDYFKEYKNINQITNKRWGFGQYYRKMEKGDELYEYSSPRETWENLCGRSGIVIVRDGFVIENHVTRMN